MGYHRHRHEQNWTNFFTLMDKHLQACSPEFFDRPFFIAHGYDETMSELLHSLEGEETKNMVCKKGVRHALTTSYVHL
jgi:hypothetical protein